MTWDAIPAGAIGVSFVGGAESGWGQYATPRLETTGRQSVVGLGRAATTSARGIWPFCAIVGFATACAQHPPFLLPMTANEQLTWTKENC